MSRRSLDVSDGAAATVAQPAAEPGPVARARIHRRIFVAVALAPALRRAVADLEPRLGAAGHSLRWVPPHNLHFTLKFLGEITAAQLAKVSAVTRTVGAGAQSFAITLADVGAFPSPRRPQVVWVGVAGGADHLSALAGDLDTVLHRMKFPKEPRPFRPHLTVARVKRSGPAPDLTELLGSLGGIVLGTQQVTALLVMESILHPSGAVYRQVDEVRLGESG